MREPAHIAAHHQSTVGKLFALSVPESISNAVTDVCAAIDAGPLVLDVGSIGTTCNISLNRQGLLTGLMAKVRGLESKPIESVEIACASGGQDRAIPLWQQEKLLETLPVSRWEVIEGCGHLAYTERPNVFPPPCSRSS